MVELLFLFISAPASIEDICCQVLVSFCGQAYEGDVFEFVPDMAYNIKDGRFRREIFQI